MRSRCSTSRTSAWNAWASRSVAVASLITLRATNRAIVPSDMRLTTAFTSRGVSSSSGSAPLPCDSSPTIMSGES